jgi:hypothetical protein
MTTKKTIERKPGRPRIEDGAETVPVSMRMTVQQREKLTKLGGPAWVREKIDKAKVPKE